MRKGTISETLIVPFSFRHKKQYELQVNSVVEIGHCPILGCSTELLVDSYSM